MRPNMPFFFDFVFLALLVVFFATQVIVPLWRERPMFPMFRKARKQANASLRATLERKDVEEITRETRRHNKRKNT